MGKFKLTILALFAFAPMHLCAQSGAALSVLNETEEVYVHNLAEFELHVILHQQRVERLGLKLLELFPHEFEEISVEMLIPILKSHDYSKLNGYFRGKKISYWLLQFYGRPYSELSEEEKSIRGELIAELNRQDEQQFVRLIKNLNLKNYPIIIKKLSMIEHIADLVDRGMDPVANVEFGHLRDGKKMTKASIFLLKESEMAAHMARRLESFYVKTVDGFSFTNSFGLCNLLLGKKYLK